MSPDARTRHRSGLVAPQRRKIGWPLAIVLTLATAALALGLADLGFAVFGSDPFRRAGIRQLIAPAVLSVLGMLAWILALPGLSVPASGMRPSRFPGAFAVLFGSAAALLGAAELAAAAAESGMVALVEYSLLLSVALGAWCAWSGFRKLLRENGRDAH